MDQMPAMPGRDQVMLDMLYDIQTTVGAYPEWQQYLREITPPTLIAWGQNDAFVLHRRRCLGLPR